jgi:hypothetical protein
LLPARVEDYVCAGSPVRAIEAQAEGIDLAGHLKQYVHGYLNRVSAPALASERRPN